MQYNILDLVDEIRTEGNYHYTPTIYIGKVISPLPNISIQFNNMILKKNQIKLSRINYFFEKNNDEYKLKPGDNVILWFNNNDSTIIIIDKVVDI